MNKKTIIYLSGFMIALLCGILLFQSMYWGPWAYNDSSAYISAARNFAAGNDVVIIHSTGKIKKLTEFPPFYPIFISLFGGVAGDYTNIIRWINSILFSLSIFFFFLFLQETIGNYLITLIGTIIFLSFNVIVKAFSGAMSEPLFLFLLLVDLFIFYYYLTSENKYLLFFLLIIVSAVLPVSRYAGILFVGIISLSLFLFCEEKPFGKRISYSLIYLIASFTPITVWGISLLQKFNKFAGKRFSLGGSFLLSIYNSIVEVFHVAKFWMPYVEQYAGTFISKFLAMFALIIFFVILIFPFLLKKDSGNLSISYFKTINLAIIGYIFLIAFMHTTSSPQIDIIDRTLMPIFPLTTLSALFFINSIISKFSGKLIPGFIMTIAALFFIRFNLFETISFSRDLAEFGLGYTSRELQQSGILDEIDKIANTEIMVSNLSGFVLFHTNRYPIQIDNFPQFSFGSGDSYGEPEFREKEAALIIIKSDFANYYGDMAADLYTKITKTLRASYEDDEGSIYYYK